MLKPVSGGDSGINLVTASTCLPSENIAGGEAGQQTAEMSLPGNTSDKSQHEKTDKNRNPEIDRNRYRKDHDFQPGDQHNQHAAEGKNRAGSTDGNRIRRQQHKKRIAHDTADEIDKKKSGFADESQDIHAEEIECEHVKQNMEDAIMNKHVRRQSSTVDWRWWRS